MRVWVVGSGVGVEFRCGGGGQVWGWGSGVGVGVRCGGGGQVWGWGSGVGVGSGVWGMWGWVRCGGWGSGVGVDFNAYLCTHTSHTSKCSHTHAHTCAHTHIYTYIHIHTYIRTHTHTQTHKHTHIYTLSWSQLMLRSGVKELLFSSDSQHLVGKALSIAPRGVLVMPNFQHNPVKVVTKMRAMQVSGSHGDYHGESYI